MTSSESDGQHGVSSSRKRSRGSAEDGGGAKEGKKARGRPRVDTQDATAADRRRTQIRLAQRAYRQRKETTISSLKQQSTQLHSVIEQMNKTFLHFNDATIKSGLLQINPGLARELKHATETFANLTRTASELEANDEDAEGVDGDVTQKAKAASPPQDFNIGWGYTAAMPDRTEKPNTSASPLPVETQPDDFFNNIHESHFSTSLLPRRQFTIGEMFDQSRNASSNYGTRPASPTQPPPLPFGMVNMLNGQNPYATTNPRVYSVNIPTPEVSPPMTRLTTPPLQLPPLTKSLAPDFTYSHDETNFARRLTRAALETGFHLLSTANVRPSALNYVFKLSLPYLSLDQLRARFKMMLARSVHEELDFWETPFIHLGGAGTHYPRRDSSGNIMQRKNNWTIRQVGPVARMENVADGRWKDLSDVDLGVFEGEWFDAWDVQGYLEECWGCRVDARSSFAECRVESGEGEVGSPGLMGSEGGGENASSSTGSASITPPTDAYNLPEAPFGLDMNFNSNGAAFLSSHDFSKFANIDMSFDQTLGLDLAPGFDYGFPDVADNAFGSVDMDLAMDVVMPVVKQKRKKVAWLEVNRLVDEIIKHGVCLGRAPGFRRRDVDIAVQKALVSAY